MIYFFHLIMVIFITTTISMIFLTKYLSIRKGYNKKGSIRFNDGVYELFEFISFCSLVFFVSFNIFLIIYCFFVWPIFNILMLLTYICFGIILATRNRETLINMVDESISVDDKLYVLMYIALIIINILNPIWFIVYSFGKKFFNIIITENVFYKTYKNKIESNDRKDNK